MEHNPKNGKITHEVLDLHYIPDEGQGCFTGTLKECHEFVSTQSPVFMYEVVGLTKEQMEYANEIYNPTK